MAKKFFYVCAGLFLLALTYHLGATSVGAQSGTSVVAVTPDARVYCASGDVCDCNGRGYPPYGMFRGNVFTGAPTASQGATWGQVKSTYRK